MAMAMAATITAPLTAPPIIAPSGVVDLWVRTVLGRSVKSKGIEDVELEGTDDMEIAL